MWSGCLQVAQCVTSGITEQIYFLPPECRSRRTRPASLTWSGGKRGRHQHKKRREKKIDVKMPPETPFLLLQKRVHSLPFHPLMIYIPSAIFKTILNAVVFGFFCSKYAFVICMCKQRVCSSYLTVELLSKPDNTSVLVHREVLHCFFSRNPVNKGFSFWICCL